MSARVDSRTPREDRRAKRRTLAISCLDHRNPVRTAADLARFARLGRALAPHARGASQGWAIVTGCLDWPVPVVDPAGPVDVVGAPPVLLVNATHDPSTPYVWAQQMASTSGAACC